MNSSLLIYLPLAIALVAFIWPNNQTRPWLLPLGGALHAFLVVFFMMQPPSVETGAWIAFDSVARAILPAVSLLFFVCAIYGVSYLKLRSALSNRVFVSMMLAGLGLMSAAHMAVHLGVLWVMVEAVTLSTVPLVHFNKTPRALEATWKYLLLGGTGIALSLLGSFCLGYASLYLGGSGDLTFAALSAQGANLSHVWVLIAWPLLLVGYGTKMGLAPMHTWKPDAYGEAPGIAGAMLAGGVTSVSFSAILRIKGVVDAAGAAEMTHHMLLIIGLFSTLVSGIFLLGTRDFKRMLAYSSIEHMGVLSLGIALGGVGLWAALFHVWNNAVTKGSLFLSVGNIRRAAGARNIDEVNGMSHLTPQSTLLFVTGLFAITACPPFGPFFSELIVIRKMFAMGYHWSLGFLLFCLFLAFCGLTRMVFSVVYGKPTPAVRRSSSLFPERLGTVLPPLILLLLSLWLGLATPSVLKETWSAVVTQFSIAQ